MAAMRVYLGSDHGGYELKQFIIEHLRQGEHEPIDCGAYTYDAEDDYPAFCIAAALKTVADPGSLGIVLGGSGNGEQGRANKVPGARCALAWSTETASLARQHNNARLIGIGGRMHTVEGSWRSSTRSCRRRGRKRHAINGVSTSSTTTNAPVSRRRFPARRHNVPEIPAVDVGAQPVLGVLAAATASSASSNGMRRWPSSTTAMTATENTPGISASTTSVLKVC